MSFLAPLYALGVLAVGLPILFHLIQRRPKGQRDFSSTMFLTASPPRLTKRSRLENWPLLLLRAAAVVLLALAFARPFARSAANLESEPPGRQIVVLLDTSASMRRGDLWQQAGDTLNGLLAESQPSDQIAVAKFDSTFQPIVNLDQTAGVPVARRKSLITAALGDVAPTWHATDLGAALVAAADLLHAAAEDANAQLAADSPTSDSPASTRQSQIVLISDLQSGADIDFLKGYQWPQDISLDVRTVSIANSSNASVSIVATDTSAAQAEPARQRTIDAGEPNTDELRVRVRNTGVSDRQQFQLSWVNTSNGIVSNAVASDALSDTNGVSRNSYSVQVPAGATRIAHMPRSSASTQLVLQGDDETFDNSIFVAPPTMLKKQLLYIGNQNDDPQSSLSYYLQRATFNSARLTVDFHQQLPDEFILAPEPNEVPLIVVGDALQPEGVNALRSYIKSSGRVLYVLNKPITSNESSSQENLRELTGATDLVINEATVDDYAMFSKIDFQHAVFQPFADPRFNDFTKIHFWAHRVLETGELIGQKPANEQAKVLAQFDDRSPALIEFPIAAGRLWVLAAGWQPTDSQLALSTKFVPLLYGMFDPTRGQLVGHDSYVVGQTIELPADAVAKPRQLCHPDGRIENMSTASRLVAPELPGVYRLIDGAVETPFAVNLAVSESDTMPMDVSNLETHGIPLATTLTAIQLQTKQRQMRDVELEGGQRLWHWLVVAALGILAIETLLGGWLSTRQFVKPLPAT